MTEPTKGPWYVLNRSLPDGATIYGCAGGTGEIIACSIGNESDARTMAASLELLAASLELLAALEAMHNHFGVLEENHMLNEDARNASRMARAAIAKAKGDVTTNS